MPSRKQENSDELTEIILNPIKFFAFITGYIPTDYQQQILLDDNKHITVRASRQSGKTEVIAVKILQKALLINGFKTLIIAPTERQSSIVFNKIDSYLNHHYYLNKLLLRHSHTYTLFDNGSEIYCLPGANPETIRGYSPHMIVVDEAAFVKDTVYTAIEPSMSATNGTLILISTPFGKQGRFYDSHARLDYYSKYHIPYNQCPFISKEYLEKEKQSKTEMEFQQEYEAEFVEEQDTYFPLQLIKACIADTENPLKEEGFNYYLGLDPARFGTDETVYCITRTKDGLLIEVTELQATKKLPTTDVIGRTKALHDKYNFSKIYVDETGLGAGAVDLLKESGLPIESITFTLQSKQELYQNLKLLMEQNKIKFFDNTKLLFQLAELQYEYTSNKQLKLHHPDKLNAHDDYPDALALSVAFTIIREGIALLKDEKELVF
ncbi:MAG: phage terminase large subunit [Candidatus Diapherotrites archaeon]